VLVAAGVRLDQAEARVSLRDSTESKPSDRCSLNLDDVAGSLEMGCWVEQLPSVAL
jgi:hypothetical protein